MSLLSQALTVNLVYVIGVGLFVLWWAVNAEGGE